MKKPVHFRKFARNRRAERTERQGAGGISKFLFWGEDLSGSFQGAGGVGGLVAHMEKPDSASWTAYYYHPDANGNIAAVTSPFRAIAAKFSYDAFGRTVTQTGSKSGIDIHALNYRFSTKPMELELATSNTTLVPPPVSSGLYYYGYRFYSPNLGRWLSRDPIREKGGQNLYNFVGNDGVGKWDILGLKESCCNGKKYDLEKECCVNKKIISKNDEITIKVCFRPVNAKGSEFASELGNEHTWIKSDDWERGMGPVDANGNTISVGQETDTFPKTKITDHSGESTSSKSICVEIKLKRCCLEGKFKLGKDTGTWCPRVNDCNIIVIDAINECGGNSAEVYKKYLNIRKPKYIPEWLIR